MKYSKIVLALLSATHLSLGPRSLGCFSWAFPMAPFWKVATPQGPRNFSVKWLIKGAQWFAWPTACRIVFGRHGNGIRFSDSWDWAAPNTIFRSISLEQLMGQWWDGVSLMSRAGGGGQAGQRREQSMKNSGSKGLLVAHWLLLQFPGLCDTNLWRGTHFGGMVSHPPN